MAREDELDESLEEGGEEKKKKGLPLKLIIIALGGVLILGGGGYFGYKFFLAKPKKPAVAEESQGGPVKEAEAEKAPEAEKKKAPPSGVVYPLDPFIVNLADPVGNRYLKVRLALDLGKGEIQPEVEAKIPQLRDAILLLLSSKTFGEINTVEGKLKLRSELLHRINQNLTTGRVTTLYFTEFVVQ